MRHVGFTLPGELVEAAPLDPRRAALVRILEPSADRVAPPCAHFGRCGGCSLQHWTQDAYAAWKHARVVHALRRAGFADAATDPLLRCEPGTRRRLDFRARRTSSGLRLGLHAPRSHDLLDIGACPVLHPKLAALIAPLRQVLNSLDGIRREAKVLGNLMPDGIDMLIGGDADASARDRTRIAAFAAANAVCRVSWSGSGSPPEMVAQFAAPTVQFAGVALHLPPGAFLQATQAGEAAIVAGVLAGLPAKPKRPRIVELFAGIGTITLPLSKRGAVKAYEGNQEAATALRRAAGGHGIEPMMRDLSRQPLQTSEFSGADVVVLDPPYAGAAAQMPALAAAKVPVVIYVSCNPAALARDAGLLHQAGYHCTRATPIDQFLWSAHIEAVCVFRLAAH